MADDKKPASSGDKKSASSDPNWVITFLPLIFVVLFLIVAARMQGENIFGQRIVQDPSQDIIAGKRNLLDIYEWVGQGEIYNRTKIINTRKVIVRAEPGGAPLGIQDKLDIGVVREGPVDAFNINWYRVDYEEAPDGWVLAPTITSKIGVVRAINIIPIIYSLYRPIGYSLLFLFLILFIMFKLKLKSEEKIAEKKFELKLESAKEVEPTIAEKIEQKPDIQELPGFQVEEIMPIAELEKQNRWQHIQDLIKSYNTNDWRQAIIEADIILEEMLDKMGYDGVTIGDKLKNVERSDFVTLDKAWAAHKVRNQIAHDGSNFKLSREVAEKTIKDFEEVFKEFYYI